MKTLKITLVFLLVATVTFAQKSPRKEAKGKIDKVEININYGAPSVKGRVIWGDLVPYNKVWRAGANENTTISFDKDVTINESKLPAGKYGFFIIPEESGDWTIIFSTKNDAWGSSGYTESNDQLRVAIQPTQVKKVTEQMTFKVVEKGILFSWDKIQLMIPVK